MRCLTVVLSLLFLFSTQPSFSQRSRSVKWEALERKSVFLAEKDVGFSNTLEGTVSDPDLDVFVMVSVDGIERWELFPAAVDYDPNRNGEYRWRAIVNLGKLDGTGRGQEYRVRVIALEKEERTTRNRRPLPPGVLKTQDVVLKRVK